MFKAIIAASIITNRVIPLPLGMVQFGLVRDWEHLKELVERV